MAGSDDRNFDGNDFEDTPTFEGEEDLFEETLSGVSEIDEDQFEEEYEPKPPLPKKQRPQGAVQQRRPARTREVQPRKKNRTTLYLLAGLAFLCLAGGVVWVMFPSLFYSSRVQQRRNVLPPRQSAQMVTQPEYAAEPLQSSSQPYVQVTQPAGQNVTFPAVPVMKTGNQTLSQEAVQQVLPAQPKGGIGPVATANDAAGNELLIGELPKKIDGLQNGVNGIQDLLIAQGRDLDLLPQILEAIASLKKADGPDNSDAGLAEIDRLKKEAEALTRQIEEQNKEITDLRAQNKDYAGKNNYLLHLNREKNKKIEELEAEFEKLTATKKEEPQENKLATLIKSWKIAGVTERFVIFRNQNNVIQRVDRGETFCGIKILDIKPVDGIVTTSGGELKYNAS